MDHLDTSVVKIVEESCKGLDFLGKIITHERLGKGVVVGYSSISGEPFAFFYEQQEISDRVFCFSHREMLIGLNY
ncbi:hypothetical protein [Cellulosilyticum sp. I15G10I2]|uniref:hypothetical protein n=1 Tax=Cellulosilyticum sp. I15G10I2 TaxID=1892843 RepID=UPI00085C4CE7|nr:hypothetical protein [Cellulosilyticum sp. I15G10I2]